MQKPGVFNTELHTRDAGLDGLLGEDKQLHLSTMRVLDLHDKMAEMMSEVTKIKIKRNSAP